MNSANDRQLTKPETPGDSNSTQGGRAAVLVFCIAIAGVLAGTVYWQRESGQEDGLALDEISTQIHQAVYASASSRADNLVVAPTVTDTEELQAMAVSLGGRLYQSFADATNTSLIGAESTELLRSFPSSPALLRRMMNAGYVLQSSLQTAGGSPADGLLFKLKLIETDSEDVIWQQQHTGSARELGDSAGQVVRSLQPVLGFGLDSAALADDGITADQQISLQLAANRIRTGNLQELRAAIAELQELKLALPRHMDVRFLQWRAVDNYAMAADDDLGHNRIKMLDEMLAIDPGHRGSRRAYAMRLWFNRQYVSSWRAFELLLSEDPDDSETAMLFADFLLLTGYLQEGIELAQQNLLLDPISVAAHLKVAEAARVVGDDAVLRRHAELLREIGGHSALMYEALLAFREGDMERSVPLYEQFSTENGGDPTWIRPFFDLVHADRQQALLVLENASDTAKSFELGFMNIYAMYGFDAEALRVFEYAVAQNWRLPKEIWSPELANMRVNPEFSRQIIATGLTELWQRRGEPDRCDFNGARGALRCF